MRADQDITVTLESAVQGYSYDTLGLSFASTEDEILRALHPVILEAEGVDILEDEIFMVKYINDTEQIAVYPKSTAGAL